MMSNLVENLYSSLNNVRSLRSNVISFYLQLSDDSKAFDSFFDHAVDATAAASASVSAAVTAAAAAAAPAATAATNVSSPGSAVSVAAPQLTSSEDSKENKYFNELQDRLSKITVLLRDLEQNVTSLTPPTNGGAFSLGNTAHLSQEISLDRLATYNQLVLNYKWTNKTHEYSTMAGVMLSQNSLKRSYIATSSTKRRRIQSSSHNLPPEVMENLISNIDRLYSDMTVTTARSFIPNPVLQHWQITLGRIIKCLIAFKGLMIEWVVVKGSNESTDLWKQSRHKVFRKVSENAHAAMLHFFSPTLPEIAVRSFMTWLHSYINLFNDPCKKCGRYLVNNLPPTWHDFRSLEAFHEECK